MLPLPRLAPHLPRSFDPLYNRVQLLYNRHNNSQNYLLQQQQPHLLRSNYVLLGGQQLNNNSNHYCSPLGGAHFCNTANHQFSHQLNNEPSAAPAAAAAETAAELNLEQYYDQIKSKLQNNEINFQRPVNNLKFVEYENLFAYNVLKGSAEYEQTVGAVLASASSGTSSAGQPFWPANLAQLIFEPEQLQTEEGTSSCFQRDALESLRAQIHRMNAPEVIRFQKYLLSVIPFCADERDWERIFYQSAFCSVWQALDRATVNLLADASLSTSSSSSSTLYELLAISGLWFEMGLAKDVTFNRALLRRLLLEQQQQQHLCKTSENTAPHQFQERKVSLMHLTFALNLSRSVEPSQVNSLMAAVSAYLNEPAATALTLDELSVVAMSFFKTMTRMPQHLLERFIALCIEQFDSAEAAEFEHSSREGGGAVSSSPSKGSPSSDGGQSTSTIAVASALKLIRFSLETTDFDARSLREPVRTLVDRICAHQSGALLDSNICLTHLILLLNSAYLQNCRRLYKIIFDRMVATLEGFRIKDIERVLFCLANVYFVCPNFKLKALEDYLIASEESQLYPYHVYNITYYLMVLNFFPHRLIGLCADPAFLEKAVDSFKLKLTDTLLITDSILRLEAQQPGRQILSDQQHVEYHREQMAISERNIPATTKRARFLRATRDILAGEAAYADRLRLMYLFPFAKYPFPVLLSPQAARSVPECPATENIFHDAVPYRLEQLVAADRRRSDSREGEAAPISFRGSTAVMVLVNKDKTYGSNLRGFTLVNKRLLERLGFRVVLLEQRDYPDMVLPRHLFQPTSPRYLQSVEQLLASVAQAETKTSEGRLRRTDDPNHHHHHPNRRASR